MARHKTYVNYWWDKDTKHIGLHNYKAPWKENGNPPMFCIRTNGAKRKNGDKNFDLFIHLGYWILNYSDFDFQKTKGKRNERF